MPEENERDNTSINNVFDSNISIGNSISGDQRMTVDNRTESKQDEDLAQLAAELKRLKQAMVGEAETAEQYAAVSQVAYAEEAANATNPSGVHEALANTGKWALSVASGIGVPLAIAALKRALGMDN